MASKELRIRVVPAIGDVPAAQWDGCANPPCPGTMPDTDLAPDVAQSSEPTELYNPFISHDFLSALEQVAETLDDATILREVLSRRAAGAEDPRDQAMWLGKLGLLEWSHGTQEDAVAEGRAARPRPKG